MSTETSQTFTPRLGSPEEFARAASLLAGAGFDEATVCRLLKIEDMADLNDVEPSRVDYAGVPPHLELFVRLFLLTETVPRFFVERTLAQDEIDALVALGLLRVTDFSAELCYSPVFLYPVGGLLIASDRRTTPDGAAIEEPPDVVFPAIDSGTLFFLCVISKSPARDALDLGAGTGIAALVLSQRVARVVASDITARAAHFIRFNRLLNRCESVEVVEGDMYAPVCGRTFERIVSHVPYVPDFGSQVIYRDGGETGETFLRRAVEGLPRHLRPGGTFYAVCLGHDTAHGSFEERVRGWLGDARDEFDVLFGLGNAKTVKEFLARMLLKKEARGRSIDPLEQALERAGTLRLVYGALVVRRHAEGEDSKPWTARREIGQTTQGEAFDRAIRWHHRRARPDFYAALARAKPRLAPHVELNVRHAVRGGAFVPVKYTLETWEPFPDRTEIDGRVVPLLARFDGARTTAEVYDAWAVSAEFGLEDFMSLAATLAERGYLLLDETFLDGGR